MRIGDWSSDVCSSDLYAPRHRRRGLQGGQDPTGDGRAPVGTVGPLGQISRKYVRHSRRGAERRGRRPAGLRRRRMDGAETDELPRARPDLSPGDQVVPRPALSPLRKWLLPPPRTALPPPRAAAGAPDPPGRRTYLLPPRP